MTSVEFEDLLRARTLGALLPSERERLDLLAADDADRSRQVAEVDAVMDAFGLERQLRAAVIAASEPREDGDPVMQRLMAAAAGAERELRARLLHPVGMPASARADDARIWRRRVAFAALVAAAVLLIWLGFFAGEGRLDSRRPDDVRSGAALHLVLLQPTLTAELRTISWAAVPGASGYHARILDRSGAVVLERGADLQRSTAWELSPQDYAALLPQRPLRLRVTALDGVGLPIGSSGDLELTLR